MSSYAELIWNEPTMHDALIKYVRSAQDVEGIVLLYKYKPDSSFVPSKTKSVLLVKK